MHRSVAGELGERLKRAYRQVTIGNPLDDGVLIGPLVNEQAVTDMMAALVRIEAEGGQVLTGGHRLPDKGPSFVDPTILRMAHQTPVV